MGQGTLKDLAQTPSRPAWDTASVLADTMQWLTGIFGTPTTPTQAKTLGELAAAYAPTLMQQENRDFRAQAIQDLEPAWKQAGRSAIDFVGGLFEDPFTDSPSVQKGITQRSGGSETGMLAAAAPLGLVGPTAKLKGVLADAVGTRQLPAPLGSLARTLEMHQGDLRLKPQVVDRYGTLHEVGGRLPTTANWEGTDSPDFSAAFSGDVADANRYADMWGATSPNTSVGRNTDESLIARSYSLEHGGAPIPLDVAQAKDAQGKQLITMAGSKVPNLKLAAEGQPLSGPKVREMGNYMAGRDATPIDTHILFASGSDVDKLDLEMKELKAYLGKQLGLPTSGAGSLNDQQVYDIYASTIKDALQKVAPGAGHNQVFGQMWEGTKAWKGQASEGGPKDILRALGLMKPGAMRDPKMLRAALQKAGIAVPWIGAILAALQLDGGDGGGA